MTVWTATDACTAVQLDQAKRLCSKSPIKSDTVLLLTCTQEHTHIVLMEQFVTSSHEKIDESFDQRRFLNR